MIIDKVGDSHNHPSFYLVMKTRGRFARLTTTSSVHDYEQCCVFNDKSINDYDTYRSLEKGGDLFEKDLAHLFQFLQAGNIKPKIVSRVGSYGLDGEWKKIMTGGTSGIVKVQYLLPGQTMMKIL